MKTVCVAICMVALGIARGMAGDAPARPAKVLVVLRTTDRPAHILIAGSTEPPPDGKRAYNEFTEGKSVVSTRPSSRQPEDSIGTKR